MDTALEQVKKEFKLPRPSDLVSRLFGKETGKSFETNSYTKGLSRYVHMTKKNENFTLFRISFQKPFFLFQKIISAKIKRKKT